MHQELAVGSDGILRPSQRASGGNISSSAASTISVSAFAGGPRSPGTDDTTVASNAPLLFLFDPLFRGAALA
jgi:hypothetical protein